MTALPAILSGMVDDLRAAKHALRKQMRADLTGLTAGERAVRSAQACDRLVSSGLLAHARSVLAFLSLPHELDTTPLVDAILAAGQRLLVPRVDVAARRIAAVAIRSLDEVRVGHYGVREPVGGVAADPASIDLVIVPGLAFDRQGGRLGHGAGYYDGFLPKLADHALACGFGFELQVVAKVPMGVDDWRLGALATEVSVSRS